MDRLVRCPVCRSAMSVPEENPPEEQTCAACGTNFRLPLKRRKASEGDDEEA